MVLCQLLLWMSVTAGVDHNAGGHINRRTGHINGRD